MSAVTTPVLSRRGFLRSETLVPIFLILVVGILVIAPLVKIVLSTLTVEGLDAWQAVLASKMSENLWWRPLLNTVLLGVGVAMGCLLMGGFLAWLVVLTDVPAPRTLGLLATLPFMIPSLPQPLPGALCSATAASAVLSASSKRTATSCPTGSPGACCRH